MRSVSMVANCSHDENLISQKVYIKLFRTSQSSHKPVNLSFIINNTNDKLTNLCGNRLLRNGLINTLCEIKASVSMPVNSTQGPWYPQSKVIFGRFPQLLAINAYKMAPSTGQWLQERVWDAPTKGLLWVPATRSVLISQNVFIKLLFQKSVPAQIR